MGVRFFDNVLITGLSASGTTDANGSWNTSVDLDSFVTIPDGATGVILRVTNTDSSNRWAGVRTPGKTTAEWQIDTLSNGSAYDVICQLGAGNTIDLYCESATQVTFRIIGITDSSWSFYDIDSTRPSVTSTSSNWATRTWDVPDGTTAILTSTNMAGWRPVGASTNTTNIMSGFKVVGIDGSKQVQFNVGTAVTAIAAISGGVVFPSWLSRSEAPTFDSTWRKSTIVELGKFGAYLSVDKSGTSHKWDFRENGSAYAGVPAGNSPLNSMYVKLNGSGEFDVTAETGGNGTMYALAFFDDFDEGDAAAITDLDGGNTTAQYQVKTANVTGFTGPVTSGTLGGVALLSVVDNEDGTVDFRAPGSVASGTRTLVLTDGTDSPELEVTHTQTHAYTAPTTVDTNSLFYGQAYETGSYFRIVTDFEHITLDAEAVDLAGTWGDNLNDIALADPGYEGPDAITLEMLYVDGATAQWTVSVTVSAGGIIVVDSGSRKGIRNSIRNAVRNAISNSVKGV